MKLGLIVKTELERLIASIESVVDFHRTQECYAEEIDDVARQLLVGLKTAIQKLEEIGYHDPALIVAAQTDVLYAVLGKDGLNACECSHGKAWHSINEMCQYKYSTEDWCLCTQYRKVTK